MGMYRREFRKIIRSAKKNFLKVLKLKKKKERKANAEKERN